MGTAVTGGGSRTDIVATNTPAGSAAHIAEAHWQAAERLVAEAHAAGGLAPVDLERFWADQDVARADPFGAHIPQVPLGVLMGDVCVYDELRVPEDLWRYEQDAAWAADLNRAYNDLAERIVGRRLLRESRGDPNRGYPPARKLHHLFESENVWQSGSWWLPQSAHTEDELQALLDRVDARLQNLRAFLLPPKWDEAKARLLPRGIRPPLYRSQRGPVTFATSIYGVENLIFLLHDKPDLARRFSDTILRAMLGIARVLDEEAGYTLETAPHGFSFLDDNSCLLTPAMYELFGFPVLKGVFERYSPNPEDRRYQHSDSAMGHLLPLLRKLGLNGTNFGPTLTVAEIRQHLPRAVIYGQLAPYTLSQNLEVRIVAEFLRDFEMARETRGLVFATAGSINQGSRLTSMRLIMAAIQRLGRYDR